MQLWQIALTPKLSAAMLPRSLHLHFSAQIHSTFIALPLFIYLFWPQIAVVHSNVWNCNHSCRWMAVINVLHHMGFDGQCEVRGEPSQRRTSAKWCAIIWSVWSFVGACGEECVMSRQDGAAGAIITVCINCIVDGTHRLGVMNVYAHAFAVVLWENRELDV